MEVTNEMLRLAVLTDYAYRRANECWFESADVHRYSPLGKHLMAQEKAYTRVGDNFAERLGALVGGDMLAFRRIRGLAYVQPTRQWTREANGSDEAGWELDYTYGKDTLKAYAIT